MVREYTFIVCETRHINSIRFDFAYQRKKINGKIRVVKYNLRDVMRGTTTFLDVEFDSVEEAKAWVAKMQHRMTHN